MQVCSQGRLRGVFWCARRVAQDALAAGVLVLAYKFAENVCIVQEIGPRFTLKLTSLQKGTFDAKTGEFEWVHKRGEMDMSRRKFHL